MKKKHGDGVQESIMQKNGGSADQLRHDRRLSSLRANQKYRSRALCGLFTPHSVERRARIIHPHFRTTTRDKFGNTWSAL